MAEGWLFHKKTYSGVLGTRAGVGITRGLALRCFRLGLTRKADVAWFPLDGGPPVPVKYERGKQKADDCSACRPLRRPFAWKSSLVCLSRAVLCTPIRSTQISYRLRDDTPPTGRSALSTDALAPPGREHSSQRVWPKCNAD